MSKRPFEPAPLDPGPRPGGIRDRALKAVQARGRTYEDPAKTRASQEYWAKVRAEQQPKAAHAQPLAEAAESAHASLLADVAHGPLSDAKHVSLLAGELPDIAAIVGDIFSTELAF